MGQFLSWCFSSNLTLASSVIFKTFAAWPHQSQHNSYSVFFVLFFFYKKKKKILRIFIRLHGKSGLLSMCGVEKTIRWSNNRIQQHGRRLLTCYCLSLMWYINILINNLSTLNIIYIFFIYPIWTILRDIRIPISIIKFISIFDDPFKAFM